MASVLFVYCDLCASISSEIPWARCSMNMQEEKLVPTINSAKERAIVMQTVRYCLHPAVFVFSKARNERQIQKESKKQSKKRSSIPKPFPSQFRNSIFFLLSQKIQRYKSMAARQPQHPGKNSASTAAQPPCIPIPLFFIFNLTIKYFPMPESFYCQRAIFCFVLIIQMNKRGRKEEVSIRFWNCSKKMIQFLKTCLS